MTTTIGIGSRVRCSHFGEWQNGTVIDLLYRDRVSLVRLDNGKSIHVISSRLRDPVDE